MSAEQSSVVVESHSVIDVDWAQPEPEQAVDGSMPQATVEHLESRVSFKDNSTNAQPVQLMRGDNTETSTLLVAHQEKATMNTRISFGGENVDSLSELTWPSQHEHVDVSAMERHRENTALKTVVSNQVEQIQSELSNVSKAEITQATMAEMTSEKHSFVISFKEATTDVQAQFADTSIISETVSVTCQLAEADQLAGHVTFGAISIESTVDLHSSHAADDRCEHIRNMANEAVEQKSVQYKVESIATDVLLTAAALPADAFEKCLVDVVCEHASKLAAFDNQSADANVAQLSKEPCRESADIIRPMSVHSDSKHFIEFTNTVTQLDVSQTQAEALDTTEVQCVYYEWNSTQTHVTFGAEAVDVECTFTKSVQPGLNTMLCLADVRRVSDEFTIVFEDLQISTTIELKQDGSQEHCGVVCVEAISKQVQASVQYECESVDIGVQFFQPTFSESVEGRRQLATLCASKHDVEFTCEMTQMNVDVTKQEQAADTDVHCVFRPWESLQAHVSFGAETPNEVQATFAKITEPILDTIVIVADVRREQDKFHVVFEQTQTLASVDLKQSSCHECAATVLVEKIAQSLHRKVLFEVESVEMTCEVRKTIASATVDVAAASPNCAHYSTDVKFATENADTTYTYERKSEKRAVDLTAKSIEHTIEKAFIQFGAETIESNASLVRDAEPIRDTIVYLKNANTVTCAFAVHFRTVSITTSAQLQSAMQSIVRQLAVGSVGATLQDRPTVRVSMKIVYDEDESFVTFTATRKPATSTVDVVCKDVTKSTYEYQQIPPRVSRTPSLKSTADRKPTEKRDDSQTEFSLELQSKLASADFALTFSAVGASVESAVLPATPTKHQPTVEPTAPTKQLPAIDRQGA
jgi:hypothetical protein